MPEGERQEWLRRQEEKKWHLKSRNKKIIDAKSQETSAIKQKIE